MEKPKIGYAVFRIRNLDRVKTQLDARPRKPDEDFDVKAHAVIAEFFGSRQRCRQWINAETAHRIGNLAGASLDSHPEIRNLAAAFAGLGNRVVVLRKAANHIV